jgi:hypothetical protein
LIFYFDENLLFYFSFRPRFRACVKKANEKQPIEQYEKALKNKDERIESKYKKPVFVCLLPLLLAVIFSSSLFL